MVGFGQWVKSLTVNWFGFNDLPLWGWMGLIDLLLFDCWGVG